MPQKIKPVKLPACLLAYTFDSCIAKVNIKPIKVKNVKNVKNKVKTKK